MFYVESSKSTLFFVQNLLKQLRVIDDKIIYGANLATPTNSIRKEVDPAKRCEALFHQVRF